jgi:hypothetical protein
MAARKLLDAFIVSVIILADRAIGVLKFAIIYAPLVFLQLADVIFGGRGLAMLVGVIPQELLNKSVVGFLIHLRRGEG